MPDYEGPVSITAPELPELIALLNQVFRPQGGDMGREYARHVGMNNLENIRVIKQHGKIVSHVAVSVRPVVLGGIPTWVAGIGAVATHPEARGQGFASILMEDAVKRSVAQGADIMLISGDLGVYRRMHAVDCGCYPVVQIGTGEAQLSNRLAVAEMRVSDLPDMTALWATLPTRYLLPREDLEALFQSKWVMDKPTDWWMVRDERNPVGCGIVHHRADILMLLDWAGHPAALEHAAAWWMERYGVNSLTYIPSAMSLLPLAWHSRIQEYRRFDGTVLVIHARRFLERARPFLAERIGETCLEKLQIEAEDQRMEIALGSEKIELAHGGELALLFFGRAGEDFLASKVSKDSKLYEVLNRTFPVPLVWYGIGYV
ncbi:MAG TPA: GNAT family N-acetyltransferase [bacterium]|nr:GNAT family N-acetyltransferase [Candidatus Omnitrophota bacterium]HOJ59589.1 GNAT family N-acetyltransferase [bacterium]HOL94218.1 GNAT family N-acetyltransferase [bacterium]